MLHLHLPSGFKSNNQPIKKILNSERGTKPLWSSLVKAGQNENGHRKIQLLLHYTCSLLLFVNIAALNFKLTCKKYDKHNYVFIKRHDKCSMQSINFGEYWKKISTPILIEIMVHIQKDPQETGGGKVKLLQYATCMLDIVIIIIKLQYSRGEQLL